MALIKCSECGKEISDKAKQCMNCGAPINEEKKEEKGKKSKVIGTTILTSNRDISLPKFKSWYPKVLGTIIVIAIIAIFFMEQSLPPYSASRGNAIIFGSILAILPCIILYIIFTTMYKNAIKTQITLTNKELYGVVYKIGKEVSISYPLDKIATISTVKLLGFVNGIKIVPVNGASQDIFFIDNGEEFRKAIMNQVTEI